MAKQRTPTNVLTMKGALKKNPARGRARAGEPTELDPFPKAAPRYLNANQKRAWAKVVKMVPAGVLKASDVVVVEITACLYAEFVAAPMLMETPRVAQLRIALGALGCTPADRSKLSVDKPRRGEFDDV